MNEDLDLFSIPVLPRPETKICLAKLPHYVSIHPEPYVTSQLSINDVTLFEEEDEAAASARLACSIRCRFEKTTEGYVPVSNANFVQWSDGSWSLCIGSEIFDVNVLDMTQDEHYFVFAQHEHSSLMEEVGRVAQKLLIKPSGVSGQTTMGSPHASQWAKLAKTLSESKVKIAVMHRDPEASKLELDRLALEKQKMKSRSERHQRQLEQRVSRKELNKGMSKEWLEADDLDRPSKRKNVPSPSEDEEDDEPYDEDEAEDEEDGFQDTDSSPEPEPESTHRTGSRRVSSIVDDEDD